MFETFKATLSPMLELFLCMIIGFVAKKKALTPDNTATVLSKLENYFLVPALIINTFMKYCTISSIREQYTLDFVLSAGTHIGTGNRVAAF